MIQTNQNNYVYIEYINVQYKYDYQYNIINIDEYKPFVIYIFII